MVARLCRFIMECGLLHFAYRSDREPAIVSLIQDACAMAGRNGVLVQAVEDEAADPEVERARIAVPEHSHPGESQSNGLAESSMKELIDEVRTLKMSLETRLKGRLPMVAQPMGVSMERNPVPDSVNSVSASCGMYQRSTEPNWMLAGDMAFSLGELPIAIRIISDWQMGPFLPPGRLCALYLHCVGAWRRLV